MLTINLEQNQWDELIEKIDDERCILLIGPNLYKDKDNNILQDILFKKLKKKIGGNNFDIFPEDGFLFSVCDEFRNNIRYIVKTFYKNEYPNDTLKKIAQIPFHCIIAFTPDLLLKRTFDMYEIPHQFERFSMTIPVNKDLVMPCKKNPLLYYMMGSIEEDETIILTHDDFFNYLKNIIGDERLPLSVRDTIDKATNLVFLGFPFEKWWVQLLLRLLGLHCFKGRDRWATKTENNSNFTQIAKEQFQITFIDKEADVFVNTLYKHYTGNNANFIRETNSKTKATSNANMDLNNKRIEDLQSQIMKSMDMLNQYEKKRLLSDDPKEKEQCNEMINELNKEIKSKTGQLNLQ